LFDHVGESAVVELGDYWECSGWAVAVFGDDDVCFSGSFVGVVEFFAVDEEYDVGILFE
jgi:hypothetical protein